MQKIYNRETGCLGEDIAKRYLQKRGYRIIEQNYRTRYSEIDLIAYDHKTLVFVEVRTKNSEEFGTPEDSLTRRKIRRLSRGALIYLAREGGSEKYRIDAVCIVLAENNRPQRISHYKNITF